jgi:hypothetical protein
LEDLFNFFLIDDIHESNSKWHIFN